MVKTPKGVMTSNVYECSDAEEAILAFENICGKSNIYGAIPKYCIAEEYIGGTEYCVNTFSDGKKVHITDVWAIEKIHTSTYKNIPYNAVTDPASKLTPLLKYALAITRVFGMERGAAHIEIKDDPFKGPTLIEIGARLAGVRMPQQVKKYSNFDPYKATIEVFVKGSTKIPDHIVITKELAISFFPWEKGGKVKEICGVEAIQKLPSYDFHLLSLRPGDILAASTHGSSIPLVVYFAHKDRHQVVQDIAAAHGLFSIVLE